MGKILSMKTDIKNSSNLSQIFSIKGYKSRTHAALIAK